MPKATGVARSTFTLPLAHEADYTFCTIANAPCSLPSPDAPLLSVGRRFPDIGSSTDLSSCSDDRRNLCSSHPRRIRDKNWEYASAVSTVDARPATAHHCARAGGGTHSEAPQPVSCTPRLRAHHPTTWVQSPRPAEPRPSRVSPCRTQLRRGPCARRGQAHWGMDDVTTLTRHDVAWDSAGEAGTTKAFSDCCRRL